MESAGGSRWTLAGSCAGLAGLFALAAGDAAAEEPSPAAMLAATGGVAVGTCVLRTLLQLAPVPHAEAVGQSAGQHVGTGELLGCAPDRNRTVWWKLLPFCQNARCAAGCHQHDTIMMPCHHRWMQSFDGIVQVVAPVIVRPPRLLHLTHLLRFFVRPY